MSGIRTYAQSDLRVPPTENNHLVRLGDMVNYVAGLTKQAVRVVFAAPFVGAYNATALTLTQTTPAALIADGVTLAQDDRVLLTGQTDLTQNGIYVVTDLGDGSTNPAILTRAADFNDSTDIINGTIVPVTEGDAGGNTQWKLTPGTIPAMLDVTSLIFTKQTADTSRIVEMAFDIEGDGATTSFQFAHSLGTLNVTHELFDASTGETVVAQFDRTDTNAVAVVFGAAPADGEDFTLLIRAEADPV